MRLIGFVIGVLGLLAFVFVGAIWAVVMITPVGVFAAVAIVVVVRSNRRQAALADLLSREAERERELKRREYAAWREFADYERRRESKRLRTLRKFDSTRDPPR